MGHQNQIIDGAEIDTIGKIRFDDLEAMPARDDALAAPLDVLVDRMDEELVAEFEPDDIGPFHSGLDLLDSLRLYGHDFVGLRQMLEYVADEAIDFDDYGQFFF